jgi:hypothetical protein
MGYIIRIDKPKNSPKGTHGWQVRVHTGQAKKYYSRLFSDNKYGSRGKALVAAEEYLEAYLQKHPQAPTVPNNVPYHKGRLSRRNKSGVKGVCRTHEFNRRGEREYYWGAFIPRGPYGRKTTKKFYINAHGEEEAKRLAIEFRQMGEEAVDESKAALKEFFEQEHFEKMETARFELEYSDL